MSMWVMRMPIMGCSTSMGTMIGLMLMGCELVSCLDTDNYEIIHYL